jgi:hypothetical protein
MEQKHELRLQVTSMHATVYHCKQLKASRDIKCLCGLSETTVYYILRLRSPQNFKTKIVPKHRELIYDEQILREEDSYRILVRNPEETTGKTKT